MKQKDLRHSSSAAAAAPPLDQHYPKRHHHHFNHNFLDRSRRRQRERRLRRSFSALVWMGQVAMALAFLSGCVYYLRMELLWNIQQRTAATFQSAVQVNHNPHADDRTTDRQRQQQQQQRLHPSTNTTSLENSLSQKQKQLQLSLYEDENTFFTTSETHAKQSYEASSIMNQDKNESILFDFVSRLQQDFVDRYTINHSIDQARDLLRMGLSGSPQTLATKILRTTTTTHNHHRKDSNIVPKTQNHPMISIWIIGSSSAAGYGNHYEYSYASVLEELLVVPWTSSYDDVRTSITVRTMAMKELTEFPIAWCMHGHYWNHTLPTVIVWDFGEEFSKPNLPRIEAFLRFLSAAVVRDSETNHEEDDIVLPITVLFRGIHTEEQRSLIQHYSTFIDPIIIQDQRMVVPPTSIDEATQQKHHMATGFREFYQFSATGPDTLHAHNLSVQQHALVAWLIAMHMASAWKLSWMMMMMMKNDHDENHLQKFKSSRQVFELPKLLYMTDSILGEPWENLLVKPIPSLHCRTTFDYTVMKVQKQGFHQSIIVRANNNSEGIYSDLSNLIISGKAESSYETALEMLLLPKTQEFYNKGWVLDMDSETKRSKLLTKSSGNFLGFRDWKMAYYGVPQSGPLEILIPIDDTESVPVGDTEETTRKNSTLTLIIICESDATLPPRGNDSTCRLHRDVTFTVNGQLAPSVLIDSNIVATTAGRRTCVQITVPPSTESQSTFAQKQNTRKLSLTHRSPRGTHLKATVTNPKVSLKNGPCSIAYVIWSVEKGKE